MFNGVSMVLAVLFSVCEPTKLGSPIANQTIVFDAKQTYMSGSCQSQFHFTELNSQLAVFQKSPLPPFFKGGE